nr:ATP-binding protein [Lutispora saccharofermentans]
MEWDTDLAVNDVKFSLRTKLTMSYILIASICVSLISIISNVYLDKHFKDYIINNQEKKNSEIVNMVAQQYDAARGWDKYSVQSIGIGALENGMIIKVKDNEGMIVWDAMLYNSGMCHDMMSRMADNMYSRYPGWKGEYVENSYPITYQGEAVGKIEIGYYGPFYFTDSDLAFINTLNRVFISVGVVSLFLSFIIGALMSKRISKPITRVISTARMISRGYYGGRNDERSDTKEINQLTDAINDLAQNLESQERLRKQLTADVAHELRTPLATLQSHMEAMIDGVWEADAERLKSCHEEIMRLNRLVGDLGKLAKYESDNLTLNKTEFDLGELITRIGQNFENEFRSKNIVLLINVSEQRIFADKDKISQIIINLVSNALKYTQDSGQVNISLTGDKDGIRLSIADSGIGIAKEDLPYIFERFYRADKSRNRLTGGAGIGLTIAKAIIEAHKGRIEVQSELNKGTAFTILLPKKQA